MFLTARAVDGSNRDDRAQQPPGRSAMPTVPIATFAAPGRIRDLAAVRTRFREQQWASWNVVRTGTALAAPVLLLVAVLEAHG
jgi:hypothetical protein